MTSKERVLTACHHEEPDRVPLEISLTAEVRERLQAHLGDQDILEALGIDLRHIGGPWWGQGREGTGLPGRADFYDVWGVGYTRTRYQGGLYSEATELPFAEMDSLEQVEAYPWPSPEDCNFTYLRAATERVGEYAVVFGGGEIPDIVNGVSRGRGMERVLTDIMTRDPVGLAIIDRRIGYFYECCRRGLEGAVTWTRNRSTPHGPTLSSAMQSHEESVARRTILRKPNVRSDSGGRI